MADARTRQMALPWILVATLLLQWPPTAGGASTTPKEEQTTQDGVLAVTRQPDSSALAVNVTSISTSLSTQTPSSTTHSTQGSTSQGTPSSPITSAHKSMSEGAGGSSGVPSQSVRQPATVQHGSVTSPSGTGSPSHRTSRFGVSTETATNSGTKPEGIHWTVMTIVFASVCLLLIVCVVLGAAYVCRMRRKLRRYKVINYTTQDHEHYEPLQLHERVTMSEGTDHVDTVVISYPPPKAKLNNSDGPTPPELPERRRNPSSGDDLNTKSEPRPFDETEDADSETPVVPKRRAPSKNSQPKLQEASVKELAVNYQATADDDEDLYETYQQDEVSLQRATSYTSAMIDDELDTLAYEQPIPNNGSTLKSSENVAPAPLDDGECYESVEIGMKAGTGVSKATLTYQRSMSGLPEDTGSLQGSVTGSEHALYSQEEAVERRPALTRNTSSGQRLSRNSTAQDLNAVGMLNPGFGFEEELGLYDDADPLSDFMYPNPLGPSVKFGPSDNEQLVSTPSVTFQDGIGLQYNGTVPDTNATTAVPDENGESIGIYDDSDVLLATDMFSAQSSNGITVSPATVDDENACAIGTKETGDIEELGLYDDSEILLATDQARAEDSSASKPDGQENPGDENVQLEDTLFPPEPSATRAEDISDTDSEPSLYEDFEITNSTVTAVLGPPLVATEPVTPSPGNSEMPFATTVPTAVPPAIPPRKLTDPSVEPETAPTVLSSTGAQINSGTSQINVILAAGHPQDKTPNGYPENSALPKVPKRKFIPPNVRRLSEKADSSSEDDGDINAKPSKMSFVSKALRSSSDAIAPHTYFVDREDVQPEIFESGGTTTDSDLSDVEHRPRKMRNKIFDKNSTLGSPKSVSKADSCEQVNTLWASEDMENFQVNEKLTSPEDSMNVCQTQSMLDLDFQPVRITGSTGDPMFPNSAGYESAFPRPGSVGSGTDFQRPGSVKSGNELPDSVMFETEFPRSSSVGSGTGAPRSSSVGSGTGAPRSSSVGSGTGAPRSSSVGSGTLSANWVMFEENETGLVNGALQTPSSDLWDEADDPVYNVPSSPLKLT